MIRYDSLRDLVAASGADVVADPAEFRAALDDYFTERDLTTGDLNVLVDAVRLGALQRLIDLLDHGSDVRRAVTEAGRALARDRGSDDDARSVRAVAALGYAVGRVDEQVVRDFVGMTSGPTPTPVSAPPAATSPATSLPTAAAPPMATRPAAEDPAVAEPTLVTRAARRPLRRWMALAVVAAVAIAFGAGWWVLNRNGGPEDAVEEWFAVRTCEEEAELVTGSAAEFVLEKLDANDEYCTTYADYQSEYEINNVEVDGDQATVEVTGTQRYTGNDDSIADSRDFTGLLTLRRIDREWLISNVEWTYTDE